MKNYIANTALLIISLAMVGCGGGSESVTTTAVEADTNVDTNTQTNSIIGEQPSDIIITVVDDQDTGSTTVIDDPDTGSTTVIAPRSNIAPLINGTPNLTVQVGELYTFTPAATDEDNNSLAFSVTNKPAWITFTRMTGELTGTPMASDIGIYTGIIVSVSDGEATTQLNSFTISVVKQNTPPSISGTPNPIAKEGESYTFTPIAIDEDNDALSFSIENKPAWMDFNSTTGWQLTGTPSANDIQEYTGIIISVSDGKVTTQLDSFTITVKPSPSSATLSWAAPSTRTDGSALQMSEIGGYKVYMGTTPDDLVFVDDITDRHTTEYKTSPLSEGTYYFAVTTYATNGIESGLSAIVSKQI